MLCMADRRKGREEKLQKLKDGTLKGKQKADFYFKMTKILEREFNRFDELSSLLEVIPDSYLTEIDFQEATLSALALTDKLIDRVGPAPFSYKQEGPPEPKVTREFNITDSFPGLEDILVIRLEYEPRKDEMMVFNRLVGYLNIWANKTKKANNYPQMYTMDEFNNAVLPWIRKKAKDGKFKIVSTVLAKSLAQEVAPGKYIKLPTKPKKEEPPK